MYVCLCVSYNPATAVIYSVTKPVTNMAFHDTYLVMISNKLQNDFIISIHEGHMCIIHKICLLFYYIVWFLQEQISWYFWTHVFPNYHTLKGLAPQLKRKSLVSPLSGCLSDLWSVLFNAAQRTSFCTNRIRGIFRSFWPFFYSVFSCCIPPISSSLSLNHSLSDAMCFASSV